MELKESMGALDRHAEPMAMKLMQNVGNEIKDMFMFQVTFTAIVAECMMSYRADPAYWDEVLEGMGGEEMARIQAIADQHMAEEKRRV